MTSPLMDQDSQRKVTTAGQANARNYAARMTRNAAFRRDEVAQTSPFSNVGTAAMIGVATVVVVSIIALVLALFRSQPNTGIGKFIIGQQGGLFVLYTGPDRVERLHVVPNAASGYLISKSPDRPHIVKDEILGNYPVGMPMGIEGAPNSLLHRTDTESAWQVCDWHDSRANLSLTKAGSLQTTVIAGTDTRQGGTSLGQDKAVIVRAPTNPQPWLLFRNTRAQIGPTDYTMHSALGIPTTSVAAPMVVSPGLLNAIPPVPALKLPTVGRTGRPSAAVPGFVNADVLAYKDLDGSDRYAVVEDAGVQDVPLPVARMLVAAGGAQKNIQDSATVAHMARTAEIPLDHYPPAVPSIITPDTLCYTWNRAAGANRATLDIITAPSIPVTDKARAQGTVTLARPAAGELASKFITTPGKGWFVRVTADTPYTEAREQIGYISDSGIFYAIIPSLDGNYTDTASYLGLSGEPNLIPESVASLLLTGPDLSSTAARRQWVQPSTKNESITGPTQAPGGQAIDLPPPPLPTVTATAVQTATATVTAPPPPPPPPPAAAEPPASDPSPGG
ncbi:type VII secretion protein EccB [Mycobacteroides abscessus]|uniref:type VII secretion protein EccB n=1 Tax=Mycobacteroides abscessus TaxID=36809 RepID=UPI001042269B|nr:type VII secretion protein EccB [Mycobacteroides abscessus]